MDIQVSLAPMKPKVVENATLKFSDAAAARVKQLIAEEKNPNLKLRVYVSGGGCSGFQYGFEFDENVKAGDTQIENSGVVLLVDASSMQYLANAEVDFLDGLEGSRFVINNPNAKTTCGCGSSFAI
jgi:iron-sulfur cluster insertion protein